LGQYHVVDIEAAVKQALDALGVPYELVPCDPDFADTAAFCGRYGYTPEQSVNTIIVAGKSEPRSYVACAVTAVTKLDVNGAVRRRLGVKKASFASAEETQQLTGMMIGGVTALALPEGVPLWVDQRVMAQPEIILGGGSRSMKVKVAPVVFERLADTAVVADLAVPIAG
jgi:prolyl-tRNA editing enzyme YbaK/EbsC (Cys-tRNA(Pro) deacylase)